MAWVCMDDVVEHRLAGALSQVARRAHARELDEVADHVRLIKVSASEGDCRVVAKNMHHAVKRPCARNDDAASQREGEQPPCLSR
jgi:hypothetical protein